MKFTIFRDIEIEISNKYFDIISTQGNGFLPLTYETLLKNADITPDTASQKTIAHQVKRLVKEEVEIIAVLNSL